MAAEKRRRRNGKQVRQRGRRRHKGWHNKPADALRWLEINERLDRGKGGAA